MNTFVSPQPLPDIPQYPDKPASRKRRFMIAGVILLVAALLLFARFSYTLEMLGVEGDRSGLYNFEEEGFRPYANKDRLNMLLVGIRGEGDPDGGLLTDAMLIASVNKRTGDAALISIPRDLWVRMPGNLSEDKINEAYALGYLAAGKGAALEYAKASATRVCGLELDGAASVNLRFVTEFIDAMGGVTVNLARPFLESQQWTNGGDMGPSKAFSIWRSTATSVETVTQEDGSTSTVAIPVDHEKWVFQLPQGRQVLDGTTAMYYMRARYSSTDFDRARREQEVLLAAREKLLSMGVLGNPIKLNDLLRTFERNVVTDVPVTRISELSKIAAKVDASNVRHIVLSNAGDGLLKATRNAKGQYILLPTAGNFSAIRETCKNALPMAD